MNLGQAQRVLAQPLDSEGLGLARQFYLGRAFAFHLWRVDALQANFHIYRLA